MNMTAYSDGCGTYSNSSDNSCIESCEMDKMQVNFYFLDLRCGAPTGKI
jgi:hypothetical protein